MFRIEGFKVLGTVSDGVTIVKTFTELEKALPLTASLCDRVIVTTLGDAKFEILGPEEVNPLLWQLIEKERTWCGPTGNCDRCKVKLDSQSAFSDASVGGRWGKWCDSCASILGVQYGTGLGQRYVKSLLGPFVKIRG